MSGLSRRLRTFDGYQQRHGALAFPVAVARKYGDDKVGHLAALIAYYAFFSLFPLLLVFVTVLGFVLQDNPKLQHDVIDSALGQIPVVGSQIKTQGLRGEGIALAIGIIGALWAGLGVTQATRNAFDAVYAVPQAKQPGFLVARLKGLALLAVLGTLSIVATGISGAVAGFGGSVTAWIGGVAVGLVANFALFFAAFRLLTAATVTTRELLPGIALAAIVWEVLQLLGAFYVDRVVRNASEAYGVFAVVIGLLSWLHLSANLTLIAAEVNVVRARGLWPRPLFDKL